MDKESHPFQDSLDKKIRNLNKKLRDIQDLQQKQKQGVELKQEQIDKIQNKDNIQAQIDEINKYKKLFNDAVKEAQTVKPFTSAQKMAALFNGLKSLEPSPLLEEAKGVFQNIQSNPEKEMQKYLESELPLKLQESLKKKK